MPHYEISAKLRIVDTHVDLIEEENKFFELIYILLMKSFYSTQKKIVGNI
jgi:hypothetical protein